MTSPASQSLATPGAREPQESPAPILLRPQPGWRAIDFRELLRYRQLLGFLALRDIKVRYKQSLLGAAWAILVPLGTMVVFNVLFGVLMSREGKPTIPGVPYALCAFAALVPWQLFAHAVAQSSNSLVINRNLITKVYFPRLITPIAPILAAVVDFVIAFTVVIGMIVFYHFTEQEQNFQFHFTWQLLLLPVFMLLTVFAALSVALWLSAVNAIYRDVKYAIPFLIQLWMFVSPVVYTTEHPRFRAYFAEHPWVETAYGLNPMAGVVEGFRWTLLGGGAPSLKLMAVSAAVVVLLLVAGLFYFRRMERTCADLV